MVSIASLWEIAIKLSLGKLAFPQLFDALFPDAVSDSGKTLLPVEFRHLTALSEMTWHHRDPFDRLLIAQAQVDGLTLVSVDRHFPPYGIPLLW
jgi:PIN domain nuclease of toxin-antitoxin system